MRTHRIRARASLALLGVVAAFASVAVAGAAPDTAGSTRVHAADAGATAQAESKTALTPAERKYGIPEPKIVGDNDQEQGYGGALGDSTATPRRSKVAISLPMNEILGYVRSCSTGKFDPSFNLPELQSCCPTAFLGPDCKPDQIVHVPATDDQGRYLYSWYRLQAKVWVSSPGDAKRPYGTFSQVQVRLLAFGSIPATATLHLTQPIDAAGLVEPLKFEQLTLNGAVGTTIAGYPDPAPPNPGFDQYMRLRGRINVRIDNVRIDGQPVDVGPSCRTSTPSTLRYDAPRGWYSNAEFPSDRPGRPGGFQPVTNPDASVGQADGTLDIPRFTGCRDGAASLDPLITSLASGPDNPFTLRLSRPLVTCVLPVGGGGVKCPPYPTNEGPATPTTDLAAGPVLTSAQKRAVRAHLNTLPKAVRAAVISSLPASVKP